jgi:catechol 2,3-dioxygenase-like lactoylglutathione lyase family enzyme
VDEEAVRSGAVATASAVHHVGMSVANLDEALSFWENFLGVKARVRAVLNRPYLGEIIGIPGVSIQAAFVDLPGGVVLELLDYERPDRKANPDTTSNPGNVHLCLAVDDIDLAWKRAVRCGARPVRPEGPVVIDGGPNVGARGAYLRVHDVITLELFQRPPRR